jgi:hypothetical protein
MMMVACWQRGNDECLRGIKHRGTKFLYGGGRIGTWLGTTVGYRVRILFPSSSLLLSSLLPFSSPFLEKEARREENEVSFYSLL